MSNFYNASPFTGQNAAESNVYGDSYIETTSPK